MLNTFQVVLEMFCSNSVGMLSSSKVVCTQYISLPSNFAHPTPFALDLENDSLVFNDIPSNIPSLSLHKVSYCGGNQRPFRCSETGNDSLVDWEILNPLQSSFANISLTPHDATANADWSLPLFALLVIVSVMTSLGNGLVLFVLFRNKSLHTPSNLFIGSLACADLIIGAFVMPTASYYYVLKHNTWNLGLPVCQLWLSLDYLASCSSILNLVGMSLDRYFSIAHALSYRQYRTYKNFLVVIAIIWILSSIYTPPILLWHALFNGGVRTIPDDKCDVEFATEMTFKLVSLLFSFILPFCTLCIVYLRIFVVIHQRTKKNTQRKSTTTMANGFTSAARNDPKSNNNRSQFFSGDKFKLKLTPPQKDPDPVKVQGQQSGVQSSTEKVLKFSTDTPILIDVDSPNAEEESEKRKISLDTNKNGLAKLGKMQRRISLNLQMIRKRRSAEQQREVKAAKQLAFILLAFAICWLPYMTIYMGYATKAPFFQSEFSITFFTLSVWLGYMNSFLNPILYPLCIDSFKKAFRELLCGKTTQPAPAPINRTRRVGSPGPPNFPAAIVIGAASRIKSKANPPETVAIAETSSKLQGEVEIE